MLNDEQVGFFRTFGFLRVRGAFSAAEIAGLRAEFEDGLAAAYAATPFDGTRRHWSPMMGPRTPTLAGLLEDHRVLGIAEQLYGKVVPFMVDGNKYVGDTGWHPDSTANGGIKLFLYYEPVDGDSGALRVIPGSHRKPLYDDVAAYLQAHPAAAVTDVPAYPVASEPGDLLMFDFNIWHASAGGAPGRPMSTIAYYREPADEADAALIRQHAAGVRPAIGVWGLDDLSPWFDDWFANRPHSATRAALLARMEKVGLLDAFGVGGVAAAS
jgi:hypothetical protein